MREVNLPHAFDDAWDNVMTIMAREAVKSFAAIESRHRIRLSPHLIAILDRGHRITPEQYARRAPSATNTAGGSTRFDGYEAIATIPATGEAPEGLANTGDAAFASLWTQRDCPR